MVHGAFVYLWAYGAAELDLLDLFFFFWFQSLRSKKGLNYCGLSLM